MLTIAINKFMQKKDPIEIKATNKKGTQFKLLLYIGPMELGPPSTV
jgi:hypothetical protein